MDIPISEAQNRLVHWIKQANKTPITITRYGEPIGVIISHQEYTRLRQALAYLQMQRLSQELSTSDITATELFERSRQELDI